MRHSWRWLVLNVVLLGLMFAGLRILDTGSTPPQSDFDASQAYTTLETLNPENKPHPTGSTENGQIRQRIEMFLHSYGYAPTIQKTDFCTSMHAGCTAIENIIAVKKGDGVSENAILVTSHYDSAPAAPGAGDALASIAAMLEVARLTAKETFNNDIIFLFADGEETGLRGAMAFAEQHPEMARVKLALNFEARGVDGSSTMFETSDNNARLIETFAGAANRPVANSLMFEVYRKMPNNTDLTVYKQAGAAGLNFAFSRGVALYHSSQDNADNLSINSLAHHGDNLLTVLRKAGDMDLSTIEAQGDKTYFDLFGQKLLHWPASLNVPASIAVILILVFIGAKTGAFRLAPLAIALGGAIAVIVGSVAIGWILSYPLGVWPGIHPLDHPHPWPARMALAAGCMLIAFLAGTTLCCRAGVAASLFVNWMIMGLIALTLAVLLPGGTYLGLAPAFVFVIAGLLEIFLKKDAAPVIAATLGLTAAAYMAVYHFLFFDVVFNFQNSHLKTPALALAGLASAPLAAIWRDEKPASHLLPTAAIVIAIVIFAGAAMIAAPYTAERPRSVNLAYEQKTDLTGETTAQWRLFTYGPADMAYVAAAGFPKEPVEFDRFGGRRSKAHFLPAENHQLPTPYLTIHAEETIEGDRVLKGEIGAGRAGAFFGVIFPAKSSAKQFAVNDTVLIGEDRFAAGDVSQAYFNGFGGRAVSFELRVSGIAPLDLMLFEVSTLPDDALGLSIIEKRPPNAAPLQFGDHADIYRAYRL